MKTVVRCQTRLDSTLQAILEQLNMISTGQDQFVAIQNKLQQLKEGIITRQEELRRDISTSNELKR
jgi:hypothetical protein